MRYVKTVLNWHLPFQRYYHLNKVKQAVNIRLKSNVCMWICCMDALTHTVAYDGESAPLQSCGSHFTDHQPGSLSHYRTMWLFQTENTTTLPQTFSGFYSTDSEYTVNYSVLIRGAGQINVYFFLVGIYLCFVVSQARLQYLSLDLFDCVREYNVGQSNRTPIPSVTLCTSITYEGKM